MLLLMSKEMYFDSDIAIFEHHPLTRCCQALSISQSLNLSISLRDRDRADTIITFHLESSAQALLMNINKYLN